MVVSGGNDLGFGKLVGVETPTGLKPRENGSRGSIVRKCVPAGPKGTLRHFFRESRETASVDPDLHFLGNRPAECSSRLKLHHHDSTEMNSLAYFSGSKMENMKHARQEFSFIGT
jgi:hypothetical protein